MTTRGLSMLSDGELLRRAQAGETVAFEELYHRYHARLYRLLYGMLGNPDDAADLTQEVFVRAYSQLERLRADGNLYGWLRTTAINLGIDQIRRRGVLKMESLDAPRENQEGEPMVLQVEDKEPDPYAVLAEKDLQETVHQAILRLSDPHRVVVTMHYLEGMGVEEIAQQLGVPVGTVKSRLARAREALRHYLAPYVEGE